MGIVFLLLLLAQFEPEPRFGVSTLQEQQLASDHKYLRIRDLHKELAVAQSTRRRAKLQFVQLVELQRVVPPVPGERGTTSSTLKPRFASGRRAGVAECFTSWNLEAPYNVLLPPASGVTASQPVQHRDCGA